MEWAAVKAGALEAMGNEGQDDVAATEAGAGAAAEAQPELRELDDAWVETCRRKGWVDSSFRPQRPSEHDNNGNGWLFLIMGSACFAPWIVPDATSDAERWTATAAGILFLVWSLSLFLLGPGRPKRFDEQERVYRERRRAIVERLGGESGP
ncbi:MAG: hypothetical protein HY907_17715 [Deltaproteobacteria bacterium]|nr:hypothetical protein [Deltaproteobacteria bacterium]